MNVEGLLEVLDEIAPFELSEKWDNSGMLVGSQSANVDKIFVSLDISKKVIEQVPEGGVLITHHPLIFKPIKEVDFNSYNGMLIKELIKKDITYIALHTNYDKACLNEYFINNSLSISTENIRVTDNPFLLTSDVSEITLEVLAKKISHLMDLDNLTVVNAGNIVKKIGVCTGSGGSLIKDAIDNKCDVLITGDITHHVAMEAIDLGISLIDVTHFHSEKVFADSLKKELGEALSAMSVDDSNISVEIIESENPFSSI